ncbi:TetR/AcrR family transcriptional regulator [Phytohabitans flavus]|uniref:TetR/AcrR family transcriptional regulator n=1 Tax=Phytohabitans flavus TaxID=1076124 RepID=UPI0018D8A5EF|nr:TetR/AcrR family transcriptional regulator [Phytohabitans flavus]
MTAASDRPPRASVSAAGDRPLRADARRNRARVLDAADEIFATKGVGASTEEVAKRAGVGVGTVFRHFPTKEALLEAVLVARFGRLAEEARGLVGADDAGAAFFGFLAAVVDQSASKNAFAGALAQAGVDVEAALGRAGAELWEALGVLLTRAQAAGAVRPDAQVDQVVAVLVGASRAADYAPSAVPLILDGLRPR